jgi:hypothetical protein
LEKEIIPAFKLTEIQRMRYVRRKPEKEKSPPKNLTADEH